ncbi:hypothetical protein Tco_1170360, partial [Tanacetum coccineum]
CYSCTSKVDSETPHGSNVDIPHIHECKQTLDSMVAEKDDISETIVKVDSQMMIQNNQMTSVHNSSGLKPQCQMTFDYNRSSLEPQCLMTFEHISSSLNP